MAAPKEPKLLLVDFSDCDGDDTDFAVEPEEEDEEDEEDDLDEENDPKPDDPLEEPDDLAELNPLAYESIGAMVNPAPKPNSITATAIDRMFEINNFDDIFNTI